MYYKSFVAKRRVRIKLNHSRGKCAALYRLHNIQRHVALISSDYIFSYSAPFVLGDRGLNSKLNYGESRSFHFGFLKSHRLYNHVIWVGVSFKPCSNHAHVMQIQFSIYK